MTDTTLAAHIRALAESGTPAGKWHWSGNWKYRQYALSSWMPGHGRVTVMDFVRAGMQGAQPRFRDDDLMMQDASELVRFEVCHDATGPGDRRVYRHDVDDITHPDAHKIIAAVNALPALADLVEAVTLRHWPQDGRDCAECGDEWPCPTATALDALAVALGVEP